MNFDNFKKIMQDKKKVVMVSVAVLLLLLAIVGTTYAYFTATVIGNKDDNNVVITNGVMALEYIDGNQVALTNAVPGDKVTKTFKVKNTGNVTTTYTIYMSELINDFADKTDLVYTLTGTNGGKNVSETQVPDSSSAIASDVSIDAGVTQEYTLVITFKETNDVQDDNQGKKFSTKIQINEVSDATDPDNIASVITDLAKQNPDGFVTDDADGNIRYSSANENNYVYFNCSTYNNQSDETCEKWKIVGVFNNVELEESSLKNTSNSFDKNNGVIAKLLDNTSSNLKSAKLVKLVRANGFNQKGYHMYWNVGVSDWTNSTLKTALNDHYYNGEEEISSEGYGESTQITSNEVIKNDLTRQAIANVSWNIGGIDEPHEISNEISSEITDEIGDYKAAYTFEKGARVYGSNSSRWTGKIGLPSLSDVLANGYLISDDGQYWLLNTSFRSSKVCSAKRRNEAIDYELVNSYSIDSYEQMNHEVVPALFLNDNIKISGGSGSNNDPYQLYVGVSNYVYFAVDDVAYYVPIDYTFMDWINSDYNIRGYYVNDEKMYDKFGNVVENIEDLNAKIKDGTKYKTKSLKIKLNNSDYELHVSSDEETWGNWIKNNGVSITENYFGYKLKFFVYSDITGEVDSEYIEYAGDRGESLKLLLNGEKVKKTDKIIAGENYTFDEIGLDESIKYFKEIGYIK